MFDDRIEIWNPGKLPEELTPESLKGKHESIPRNPLIAKMLFLVKEIEQWGTGTNEMVKMCLEHGLPEPEFEETNNSFVVTIKKKMMTKEKLKSMEFNERQIKGFQFIEENDSITSSKYAEINDIAKRTARKDLSQMVEKGVIKKVGEGKNTRYVKFRNMPEYAGTDKDSEGN